MGVHADGRRSATRSAPGDVLGTVPEGQTILHKVMVPPRPTPGKIASIVGEGDYNVDDVVATLEDGTEIGMSQQLAGPSGPPLHQQARPDDAVHDGHADPRHVLPDRPGRQRDHPGRLRHGQDGHAAVAGQVGRRRHHRLHRLRRARQRDDRGAHRVPATSRTRATTRRSWTAPCSSPTPRTCRLPRARPPSTSAPRSPSSTATWATTSR